MRKLAFPDPILGKGERLGEAERVAIRAYPVLGQHTLSPLPVPDRVRKVVRCHHQRMSGEGYPDHLGGEEIPLGPRIVAICDAYDAMTNPRSYRPPKMSEKTLAIPIRDDGQQWDPRLTEAFVRVLRQDPSTPESGLLGARTGQPSLWLSVRNAEPVMAGHVPKPIGSTDERPGNVAARNGPAEGTSGR